MTTDSYDFPNIATWAEAAVTGHDHEVACQATLSTWREKEVYSG